ncbi:MAG: hypothetical protein E7138_07815 [Rikenellaceae bacterium]|nr:hypothetical protein [Rikenellaceae bacterium]
MKTWGWILLIIGIVAGIGAIAGGSSPAPFFWAILGGYLLHRAKTKEQEEKDKEKWNTKE